MAPIKAMLVTTAKNQAPYFLEWVAHHLELGFTDIVIFQHDSDDLTHQTLSTLRGIGAIQYYYNRAKDGAHHSHAYTRASDLPVYAASDWVMALDMDEFLVVKTGDGTLTDLMKVVPESDCVHLNWRIFGNSGYEVLTEQLVTERFALANHQLGAADHFGPHKCLFRPEVFKRPGRHRPSTPLMADEKIRYSNGSGLTPDQYRRKNVTSTDPGGCEYAQINRYFTRDLASFMLKSTHQPDRRMGQRHWILRNTNFDIDDSVQPILARVKARMAALDRASNGRLMALREAAIFDDLARYYTLLHQPKMRAFRRFCKDNPNSTGANAAKGAKPRTTKAARDAATT